MRITFLGPPRGGYKPGIISDVLELIEVNIPASEIALWTYHECVIAYDYAMREHYRASDCLLRHRPMPLFMRRAMQ